LQRLRDLADGWQNADGWRNAEPQLNGERA
jgi:hypothetical protein